LFEELDSQVPNLDSIYVPVGGGGLLAAATQHYASRLIRLIGVEAEWAPKLWLSLRQHTRVLLPSVVGPAEGIQVRAIGQIPFEKITKTSINSQLVTERQILAAMKILWEHCSIRAEAAGAASLAAALSHEQDNQNVACIVSGGNVNDDYFTSALAGGDEVVFFKPSVKCQ
jgi:threonine dehydratase